MGWAHEALNALKADAPPFGAPGHADAKLAWAASMPLSRTLTPPQG